MSEKKLPRAEAEQADEELDDRCDLDPDKICDNCMKCITGDAEYRAIVIDGIQLEDEYRRTGRQ